MLKGTVKNSKGRLLSKAIVELKDKDFRTILKTKTDESGYFEIQEESGFYPFLTVVKDYGEAYLEFWGLNIDLKDNHSLEVVIGVNELYGTNVFKVFGTFNPIFIYFRPMNLKKFKSDDKDISPNINQDSIIVKVDDLSTNLLSFQQVKEHVDNKGKYLTAYLIQLERSSPNWQKIELKLTDKHNDVGMAIIYNKWYN